MVTDSVGAHLSVCVCICVCVYVCALMTKNKNSARVNNGWLIWQGQIGKGEGGRGKGNKEGQYGRAVKKGKQLFINPF